MDLTITHLLFQLASSPALLDSSDFLQNDTSARIWGASPSSNPQTANTFLSQDCAVSGIVDFPGYLLSSLLHEPVDKFNLFFTLLSADCPILYIYLNAKRGNVVPLAILPLSLHLLINHKKQRAHLGQLHHFHMWLLMMHVLLMWLGPELLPKAASLPFRAF